MRKLFIFLALMSTQCTTQNKPYQPVDWQDKNPPKEQQPKPQEPQEQSTEIQQLLALHNQQRELKGRPGLELDDQLNEYAQAWADNMAKRNSLYHSNLDFMKSNRWRSGGENIAWNQQTPQEVTTAWMNSTGHRDNILNRNFTKVGFGIAHNNGQPYWCTVFAGF